MTKDWSKYGTATTFLKGYKPVMRTDEMTSEEIMEAYYYLQSFFAIDKFRSRYGRYFYFNLRFIKEYLLKNKQYGGFMRKAMMGFRLLANLLRRFVFEKSHKR